MDLFEYLGRRIREETNMQKRAQYRRDMIKAIISSYPPKVPIRMRQFSHAVGFKPEASSIYTMLAHMINAGEIKAYGAGTANEPRGYAVLKPGNTYDAERGAEPTLVAPVEAPAVDDEVVPDEPSEPDTRGFYTFAQLEALAMRHQFYNPGGTVADFIKTLKENM